MKSEMQVRILIAVAALTTSVLTSYSASQTSANTLAPPESFEAISDTQTRSAAMFTELGKVLTHPRCVNCHPAGDRPHQANEGRLHQPPVERGADGRGLPAMRCSICHQKANFDPGRVPGHPEWQLAPREMAWEGKTIGEIAFRSKTPRAMAAASQKTSSTTLARTRWSAGPGRPAMDAPPLQAPRRRLARWSKPG